MNKFVEKKYDIAMEIAGPFAHFENPSTGGGFGTYECPTFSAVKGIFESILNLKNAVVIPYRVEICNPIKTTEITTNYHGHLRKSNLFRLHAPSQLTMTMLVDVDYKLYAYAKTDLPSGCELPEQYKSVNGGHSYQVQFNRRLEKNQCLHTPVLGLSEHMPTYWGKLRDTTKPLENVNFTIPHMLKMVFDKLKFGTFNPSFLTNVEVKNGVMIYPTQEYYND